MGKRQSLTYSVVYIFNLNYTILNNPRFYAILPSKVYLN